MHVNQILPALSCHDAVSNDAIEIKNFLIEHGFKSSIFSKHTHPQVSKHTKPLAAYKGDSKNITIYHFSLAGNAVTDFVKQLPDKKILIFHNITPHTFFDKYDDNLQYICAQGFNELKDLSNYFDVGIGDSEYNRICLENHGFKNTDVLPILLDAKRFSRFQSENSIPKRSYSHSQINIIFVGRISPNKKQEDIIKAFYYYNRYIDSNSILYFIGNEQLPLYLSHLKEIVNKLGLTESVVFTGLVSDEELIGYYQKSHIFLCMSEHEGFCVPLLEAMYFELPIIAYNSTGIPYTLGDSGILVNRKEYKEIAELINVVVEENEFREKIIKKQKERLMDFDKQKTGNKLLDIIASMVGNNVNNNSKNGG